MGLCIQDHKIQFLIIKCRNFQLSDFLESQIFEVACDFVFARSRAFQSRCDPDLRDDKLKSNFTFQELKEAQYLTSATGRGNAENWTEEQRRLVHDYECLQTYIMGLPFTDDEIKTLTQPLEAIIDKYGGAPPPEVALIIAATLIILPRFTQVNSVRS
jgi:hypothetical protein